MRRRLNFLLLLLVALCSLSVAQTRKERAWQLLEAGASSKDFSSRAVAVRVLGLLPADAHALAIAEKALQDDDTSVRTAAATALGQIGIKRSIPDLRELLNDPDTGVVLAAAHALTALGDETGYDVYYVILTRQRKASGGALQDERKILKDRKQMAKLGFEQGIGYIPFASYGYGAIRALTKDDTSPVRAGAAKGAIWRSIVVKPREDAAVGDVELVGDRRRKSGHDNVPIAGKRRRLDVSIPAVAKLVASPFKDLPRVL